MAEKELFISQVRDFIARMRQQVTAAVRPMDGTPAVFQELPVGGKDSHMLKMGNRDAANEAGSGYSPEGSSARSGASKETVIGEEITIEGTVRANEDIIMEGRIKGTIEAKSHRITIGPKGQIEADMDAEDVVISGRMAGNILAHNKVQITREADFTGQIKAKRISIEDGAYIKATIEMEKEERPATKPSEAIVFEGSGQTQAKKPVLDKPKSAQPV
jgi:cytoskeletal protein CcmA (bactofilin family)